MDWTDIAAAQGGAVSRRQLEGAGCSPRTVSRLVSRGRLERHERGIFVIRGAPVGYVTRLWIAVLATGGVLGFATAAHLWQMDEQPDRIDVVLPAERRVRAPFGVRLRRAFVPRAAITRLDGLPITSRQWTLVDHLGALGTARAQRLLDRALQRGWVGRDHLIGRLQDYPGRQGNAVIRHLVRVSADNAAAESERLLHRLLRGAGVTGWRANYRIVVGERTVAVADVGFPEARLVIEVDGWAYHSDVDRFQRDRDRQNTLVALGWTVLRFTWHDLTERPGYVLDAIRQNLGGFWPGRGRKSPESAP